MTTITTKDIAAALAGYLPGDLSEEQEASIRDCDPYSVIPINREGYRTLSKRILRAVLRARSSVTCKVEMSKEAKQLADMIPDSIARQILEV